MTTDSRKVWIAGVRPAITSGLVRLLAQTDGVDVVDTAESADVIVVDVGSDPIDASASLRQARAKNDIAPMLVMTPVTDPWVDLLCAQRNANKVSADLTVDELIALVLGPAVEATSGGRTIEILSGRERDVLGDLSAGLDDRAVALNLEMSEATVRTHVRNAVRKLGFSDRDQLVRWHRQITATEAPAYDQPSVGTARPTPLILFGPDCLTRSAIGAAIESLPGWSHVSAASHPTADLDPDAIAVVVESTVERVLTTLRVLRDRRVIVVTAAPADHDIAPLLTAGAAAIVEESADLKEWGYALSAVATGDLYLASNLLRPMIDALTRPSNEDELIKGFASLSDRERQVLAMLVDGMTEDDIAADLYVSPHTARSHVQRTLRKLGPDDRRTTLEGVRRARLLERFGSSDAT